jgi:hypothetical protein
VRCATSTGSADCSRDVYGSPSFCTSALLRKQTPPAPPPPPLPPLPQPLPPPQQLLPGPVLLLTGGCYSRVCEFREVSRVMREVSRIMREVARIRRQISRSMREVYCIMREVSSILREVGGVRFSSRKCILEERRLAFVCMHQLYISCITNVITKSPCENLKTTPCCALGWQVTRKRHAHRVGCHARRFATEITSPASCLYIVQSLQRYFVCESYLVNRMLVIWLWVRTQR